MDILTKADFPANSDYHANQDLSWTKAKVFMRSPLEYKHRFLDGNDPGPTPAMVFGSLVHCMALTPTLIDEEFRVRGDMPLRSKADKERFIAHLVEIDAAHESERDTLMECKAEKLRKILSDFEKELPIHFIDQAALDRAEKIASVATIAMPCKSVDSLDPQTCNVEAAFYATIEGVPCQCKCDLIDRDHQRVYDIKTTADLHRWARGLEMGDLLLADAWYRMVIREATGELVKPIRYIGVSTIEPVDYAIREYPEQVYDAAEEKLRDMLREYRICMDKNRWPGMDGEQYPTPRVVEVRPFLIDDLQGPIDVDAMFEN